MDHLNGPSWTTQNYHGPLMSFLTDNWKYKIGLHINYFISCAMRFDVEK